MLLFGAVLALVGGGATCYGQAVKLGAPVQTESPHPHHSPLTPRPPDAEASCSARQRHATTPKSEDHHAVHHQSSHPIP